MSSSPVVVIKVSNLIEWVLPKLAKFPRDQRFLLGDKIETALLEILELLIRAAYSKEKKEHLAQANLQLELIRFLSRIAKNMHYFSLKEYDFFCQRVLEIGRMVGGWGKRAN